MLSIDLLTFEEHSLQNTHLITLVTTHGQTHSCIAVTPPLLCHTYTHSLSLFLLRAKPVACCEALRTARKFAVVHQTHHSDTRENHQQTRQDANKLQVTNLQEHQDHNYSYPIALPRLCSSSSSFSSFTSTQAHYGHYQWRYKPTHSALTCLSRAAKPDTHVCAPWHNPVTFHHQMQAVPQA